MNENPNETKPSGNSILVIDDDTWVQRLISKYLDSNETEILSVTNAYRGLATAIKEKPKLILLDLYLNELHGKHILRFLKSIDTTAEIPVLIISANLNKDILRTALKDGANGFISKPFSKETLVDKIKSTLESKSPEALQKEAENLTDVTITPEDKQ